ncbi:MAG TPA: GAF domain-containing sensor histidine kinase, partial [Polyangiaceae bacterium]|nr:GAF domain-containing sensor histidine kinase [Polyangiaceae bacterium]
YAFARAVVAADRVEDVFDAALDALDSAVGVPRSAILTFDADQVMRFRAWRGLSEAYRSAVEGHSPWAPDVAAPEPVLIEAAEREAGLSAFVPLFQRERIGALAFVPLVTRGRLIGKFMCYYEQPHRFAANEVETMLSIANHLATIIARFSATAKLEETIAQNEILAGVLAHDLRNPLNALLTAAQLLGRVDVDQQVAQRQRRFLDHILSSGWRMAAMIEQLLDFTRVRSGGGIAVLPRPMDFGELCQRALTEVRMANGDWNVQLEVRGDTQGAGDPDRLLQVLSNLVTNAGRHGTRGTPILLRVDGTSSDAVGIQVHNSGTIPPQLLPHVFEPFRSDDRRRDASRGLGIGLFIVREIVRAHRGLVEVSSSEDAGTMFAIRLPRQVTDRTSMARSQE